MISVGIPWALAGGVAVWAWKKIHKVLFYRTYLLSHRRWASKHGLGAFWEPLGEHLEYSVCLAHSTDPEPQLSRVAFRAPARRVECFEGVFEANGMGVRYQEPIRLHDINATPIVYTLVNLPVCEPVETTGPSTRYSLDTYKFRQCSTTLGGGRIEHISDQITQTLTQTWAENSHWKERWESWWNLDAIVFAQQELQLYWRWLGTNSYIGRYSPGGTSVPPKALWRPIAKTVGWVMGLRWLVNAQFWLAVWSGLFVIDEDDRLSWRWKTPAAV